MAAKSDIQQRPMQMGDWLFIVFLTLKLGVGDTDVQGWSWWWVTAPLWIGFILHFIVAVIRDRVE